MGLGSVGTDLLTANEGKGRKASKGGAEHLEGMNDGKNE